MFVKTFPVVTVLLVYAFNEEAMYFFIFLSLGKLKSDSPYFIVMLQSSSLHHINIMQAVVK